MEESGRATDTQTQELERIIERVQRIVGTSSLEKLLEQIIEKAPPLVDGAGCSVYLIPELVPAYAGKLLRGDKEIDPSALDREFIVLAATSREEREEDVGNAFYLKGEGLTGWIFENGKPLQIKDMRDKEELHAYDPPVHWADPYEASRLWYDAEQSQPFLGVPLLGARKVFGVIKVQATVTKQPFPAYAVDLFMSFASVLSTMIRKTKLLEDLTRSISELLSVSTGYQQQASLDKIVRIAGQLIDGRDLGLYLLDAFGEQIELQAAQGDYMKRRLEEGRCSSYSRGEGLTGWVFKTGKPLCIKDVKQYSESTRLSDDALDRISDGAEIDEEDRWLQWRDKDGEWVHFNDPAFLAVPIKAEDGSVLGVLRAPAVRTDPQWSGDRFFDMEDLRVFQSFADSVALYLQSMKRKELNDMLIEMGSILDEEKLFQFVVERTPRLVRARGCSILLMRPSRGEKPLVLSYTNSQWLKQTPEKVIDLAYALGEGKSGFVASTGVALVINYYGPGSIQHNKMDNDYSRYRQSPDNLVDFLRDGQGQQVGLIRLVGERAQVDGCRDRFERFVQRQQIAAVGLPSPHGNKCETGGERDARSFLAVPIKDEHGQVRGVMRLPRTDEGGNFSDEDLDLLVSIANRVTLALRTLMLLQSNQERSEKLERLSVSIRELVGELWAVPLEQRLPQIVKAAAEILDAEVCSLWQVKQPGYIELVASHGDKEGSRRTESGDPIRLPIQVGIHAGLTGYIAAGDQPVRLQGERLRNHHAVKSADHQPHIPSGSCYSLLGIPLTRRVLDNGEHTYETIGLLKAENKRDEYGHPNPLMEFSAEDEWTLRVVADTVVAVLDNARYVQELEALQRIGAEVTGVHELDQVLQMLLARLQGILSPEYAHIRLDDPQRGPVESTTGQKTSYTRPRKFPIKVQDREIGTLEVDRVSRREMQTLARFITHATAAIRNAQLFEQLENRQQELESLAEISARLIEFRDRQGLFRYIVESAASLLSAEDCSLFIVDPVRNTIDLRASSALPVELIDSRVAPIGTEPGIGLPGYVAATGESLNFTRGEHTKHLAWSGKFTQHLAHLPSRESLSVLIVPLRRPGEKVIGVLKVENKTGPNRARGFLDNQELLTTLANQAVIAISNVEIYETTEGDLQRRVDQLSALRDIDTQILTSESLDASLQTILEKAVSLSGTKADEALFALYCSDGSGLQVRAYRGEPANWADDLLADETIGRALGGARAADPHPSLENAWKLAVPVRKQEEVCGVLAMQVTEQEDRPEEALRWLEGLAGQVAIAVEREERTQELLRAQEGQAATKQALLISGLSSIYAHRTNDVVGTIPLNVQLLRRRLGTDDQEVHELLDDIKRAAENMVNMAKELRRPDFDRGEQVDVADLLHEAQSQVNIPAGIVLEMPELQESPLVFVPRLSMREVLSNILKNAVQAIEAAGTEGGTIKVSYQDLAEQGRVVIQVRDTGCGISEERQAQLFEPLWRQPGSTVKGMGYALWWAKTLLTAIGGGISAESPGPGQGATFCIWLPAQRSRDRA
jgi:GAF domain-containing protein